jgi:hypothetical protein
MSDSVCRGPLETNLAALDAIAFILLIGGAVGLAVELSYRTRRERADDKH